MGKIQTTVAVTIILIFITTATHYIATERNQVKLKAIKIESISTDISQLDIRYKNLNQRLKDANNKSSIDKEKIEQMSQEKRKLEEERKRLEAELQAKKEAKSKLASASSSVVNTATNTQTAAASPNTKEAWMTAAGIPQSDWRYVDCVINGCEGVSPEGGWGGTQRWNTTGSGAYGLCQSLPATKMASAGVDYMTNPVTQLKWCHGYAQQYGGWAQAWKFRKCLGSCFSTKPGVGYIVKDHTWW